MTVPEPSFSAPAKTVKFHGLVRKYLLALQIGTDIQQPVAI